MLRRNESTLVEIILLFPINSPVSPVSDGNALCWREEFEWEKKTTTNLSRQFISNHVLFRIMLAFDI